jgi:hypothetical protein
MAHYVTLNQPDYELSTEVATRKAQVALFTAERRGELWSVVAFSKTRLTHEFVHTKDNLMELR